jgi:hypothetical protein
MPLMATIALRAIVAAQPLLCGLAADLLFLSRFDDFFPLGAATKQLAQ